MIQPSFRTPLMPAVGAASLLQACCGPASGTAITLAAIAMLTDPEHSMTSAAAADPLPENRFAMKRHARHGRGLDNSNGSWQVRTSFVW
jgi:hypothetical protein